MANQVISGIFCGGFSNEDPLASANDNFSGIIFCRIPDGKILAIKIDNSYSFINVIATSNIEPALQLACEENEEHQLSLRP
ncbi:MAG: hypothetical protein PHW50_00705 [Patescibacteria group bacterium]|nr:hypothetical protein [Patescibacteria group bacterium]